MGRTRSSSRHRFVLPLVSLPALALAAAAAPAGILLNEVLYDAVGVDEGHEFVEILLDAAAPLDLGRVTLERGNGSRAGDWRQVWRGAAGESLAPGVHYVVGGEHVTPVPHAVANLSLQNGPDACRLLLDGIVADVVGWGDLEGEEFFAGAPAPDVPPGSSLGRVPDGRDSGRNGADFLPLPAPSPGRANERPSPLRLRSPGHRSDAGANPHLEVEWAVASDDEQVRAVEITVAPCSLAALGRTAEAALVDGESSGSLVLGPLAPGLLDLCITCQAAAPAAGAAVLRLPARAGPGPLRVNEFLYRPAPGAPEWIEVANAGPDTLDVARFALADRRSDPVPLAGAQPLPPGGLLVIAADRLPDGEPALVLGSRWPPLNDTGAPVADRIRLLDGAGRTSDDVAYGSDWAPPGESVERLSTAIPSADRGAWSAAAAGPTPGRPNGASLELTAVSGFLRIDPAIVGAGGTGSVVLQFARPLSRGVVTVHAADGRIVRRFAGEALRGRRLLAWDGRDEHGAALRPGLYLVTVAAEEAAPLGPLEASAGGGPAAARIARATLVVAP